MTRKKKRSIVDELFGGSLLDEKGSLLDGFPKSGYSISVVQTSEGTKVQAKVGNGTDVRALRAQLEQQYPNAEIEIEGGKAEPLIREISTKTLSDETGEIED